MLLAVAGLEQLQLQDRVAVLASGDWSSFAPRERVVLHLAKLVSRSPQQVTEEKMRELRAHWGDVRSLDWAFHISWANYMTRVADAFQIPLEPDNVFAK